MVVVRRAFANQLGDVRPAVRSEALGQVESPRIVVGTVRCSWVTSVPVAIQTQAAGLEINAPPEPLPSFDEWQQPSQRSYHISEPARGLYDHGRCRRPV